MARKMGGVSGLSVYITQNSGRSAYLPIVYIYIYISLSLSNYLFSIVHTVPFVLCRVVCVFLVEGCASSYWLFG